MIGQLTFIDEPRARHDGPQTSRLAVSAVSPAVGALEAAILDTLHHARGPLTAEAISESVFAEHDGRWTHGTVVTAISRCERRGVVTVVGVGLSSRGRSVNTYEVAR